MNKFTSSLNKSWLLLTAAVLAVFFALYTFLLKPLTADVQAKQYEVNRISTEVFSLKNELAELEQQKNDVPIDIYKTRKKIPQQSDVDELILQFEEIEYVSKVRIEAISFNNYDVVVSQAGIQQPEETNISASEEDKQKVGLTEEPSVPISTINPADLPPELKMLTYELKISASSEERMKRFIKELEQMERIMKIDTISYTMPGEEQVDEQKDLSIIATLRVTAFYYEGDY